MGTKALVQMKEERIQQLLQGTVPGERYSTPEFQQRTGWGAATTRVVIGYAIRRGLLRTEGPQGKRCFLRTIPSEFSESGADRAAGRAMLEHYESAWRSFQSLCMTTRQR